MKNRKNLEVISRSFENNGLMPKRHTGFGEDSSPPFGIKKFGSRSGINSDYYG